MAVAETRTKAPLRERLEPYMSTPDQNSTKRRRESAPLGWIWPD